MRLYNVAGKSRLLLLKICKMNLRDLIYKHIKEIPYEGTEVDIEGIEHLIKNLLKGFLTYSKKYELSNKGYFKEGECYSREEIVDDFIRHKL